MSINTLKIRGKRWKSKDVESLKEGLLGLCDYEDKTIIAPFEGDELHELDTIIHECLHAGYPDLNEEAIDEFATDLANILWKLNWRKVIDD